MGHFQYTANPLNPLTPLSGGNSCQGDFEDFAQVEIIGKCILISCVYYNAISCVYTSRSAGAQVLAVSSFYRHIAPLERSYR